MAGTSEVAGMSKVATGGTLAAAAAAGLFAAVKGAMTVAVEAAILVAAVAGVDAFVETVAAGTDEMAFATTAAVTAAESVAAVA